MAWPILDGPFIWLLLRFFLLGDSLSLSLSLSLAGFPRQVGSAPWSQNNSFKTLGLEFEAP